MLKILHLFLLIALTNAVINNENNSTKRIFPRAIKNVPNSLEGAYMRLESSNKKLPILVLVDATFENQLSTAKFFKRLYEREPKMYDINFMLMKFHTKGVSPVLDSTHNNLTAFYGHLEGNFNITTSPFFGMIYNHDNGTQTYFAILNGIHLIPERSTILVFLGRNSDRSLAQHAFRAALHNHIRLMVIWNGPIEFLSTNEDVLYDTTSLTGGGFYHNLFSEYSHLYYLAFLNKYSATILSTILTVKNLKGEHYVNFPIDSTIKGFHISITSAKDMMLIMTPPGARSFNITNNQLRLYSFDSFEYYDPVTDMHEIHFNITDTPQRRRVGIWSLYIYNKNKSTPYNITITASSKLIIDAVINANRTVDLYNPSVKKSINLTIIGDYNTIRKISFISENGEVINNELNIMKNLNWEDPNNGNIEILEYDRRIQIDIPTVPKKPFHVVIDGRDNLGDSFTRQQYVRTEVDNPIIKTDVLIVQLNSNSELFLQSGKRSQLYFEVTNTGNQPFFVRYFCSDQESILLSMSPYYQYINPQETAIVHVTLIGKAGTYTDIVTFTAHGPVVATKAVYVESGIKYEKDITNPKIDFQFTSDCLSLLLKSCHTGTWTVKIKAKDTESGILELTTNPKGIYLDQFIVGTTEEISGVYGDSCCYPDLQIIATDRNNNKNIVEINAYRVPLDPASISAIVFAIFVLIAVVVLIVCAIDKCRHSNNEYELPTYRGPNPPPSRQRY